MLRRGSSEDRLPPWWVEALIGVAAYGLYQLIQVLVTGAAGPAVERARDVWAVERALGLDPEVALNHLLSPLHGLVVVAGVYYGLLHFLVTPGVLVWLRSRHRPLYVELRNTLVGASLVALGVFWVLPLAPPRLAIPEVIDTLKVNQILSAGTPSWPASMANQYAAMPSLHVAWSVWVAVAISAVLSGRRLRYLAWLYPISTTLVVISTGNHFLADAVAGTLLVLAVWTVLRRRPPAVALYPSAGSRSAEVIQWEDVITRAAGRSRAVRVPSGSRAAAGDGDPIEIDSAWADGASR